jgi:hypothetical protein
MYKYKIKNPLTGGVTSEGKPYVDMTSEESYGNYKYNFRLYENGNVTVYPKGKPKVKVPRQVINDIIDSFNSFIKEDHKLYELCKPFLPMTQVNGYMRANKPVKEHQRHLKLRYPKDENR